MASPSDTPPPAGGEPSELGLWMERYLSWLRVRNYADHTLRTRKGNLALFIAWCEARGLSRPVEITKPILERYQRYLFLYRKQDGKPLAFGSQHARLVPIRSFFKWLSEQNVILHNPATELVLPRLERRLPRHVLSAAEAEQVLALPDITGPLGLRDRAMLETLYSTAIRRTELLSLCVFDLDTERGTLLIRLGKGKRDRMVPIGERAQAWLGRYLEHARPKLAMARDEGVLFLSNLGEALTPNYVTHLVSRYVELAAIGKKGSCHLFRHTVATLMLEGGADIRFIQELLGHVDLSTTQIYTQVSIRQLKEVHDATHPAAKLEHLDESERADAGALEQLLADLDRDAEDEET